MNSADDTSSTPLPRTLSDTGRILILVTAFLGWMFAGVQMSITSLAMRSAAIDLLGRTEAIDLERFLALNQRADGTSDATSLDEGERQELDSARGTVGQWFAWYVCAFLFGAATGGLVFGHLGDRIGRSKAMAAAILCYSAFSAASSLVQTPEQLLVLRFLACMGVGGMWPNGVALVAEAWSNLSRPMVAGVIGTAANVGIFGMATLATSVKITPDDWRWAVLVGGLPILLAVFVFFAVPESPSWLAIRRRRQDDQDSIDDATSVPAVDRRTSDVFRSPLLKVTLVGIALATIPLFGGWGSANWMIPWADEAGETADPPNPYLKAQVGQARSFTGMVGSLLGGWIASYVGRRRTYFLVSLVALFCAQYAFWFTIPTDASFLYWVAALGFFSGIYFGWLPLFLPELFPTRVRSTGAGVSFNFGRILTAATVFATGALKNYFEGDYARIGRVTSLIFAIGMVIIFFAPDTTTRELDD